MAFARGTTPTFTLTFDQDSVDLTAADHVYVTFSDGKTSFTKTEEELDVSAHSIDVYLSQQDTIALPEGKLEVQANWTYDGGKRAASKIESCVITRNLLDRVVS